MAVRLNDLITEARMETNTLDSGFFDDTVEMPRYVNNAVSALYDRVVGAFEQYFSLTKTFALTSTNTILLTDITGTDPSQQFYKELGLDYLLGGSPTGRAVSVPNLGSFEERNAGNVWGGPFVDGPERRYFINGPSLVVYPQTANFAGTYNLFYIPTVPMLTSSVNLPVELERWKRLIVLDTARAMKEKREQDTDAIERKIAVVEKQIDDAARNRSKEGKMIPRHRTLGTRGGGSGYWGI